MFITGHFDMGSKDNVIGRSGRRLNRPWWEA